MAVYKTSKCPHCKKYLKILQPDGNPTKLGSPVIKCQWCGGMVKTGKKLWREMNFFQKMEQYFVHLLSIVVGTGVLSSIFASLIIWIRGLEFTEDIFFSHLKYLILPLAIILFYRIKKNHLEEIKDLENDYDSQEFKRSKF